MVLFPMLKDLQHLLHEIKKYHVDPFRNISEKEFVKSLERIEKISAKKFPFQVQESLALLGDAHTRVPFAMHVHGERLPFRLKKLPGGYYIIGTSEKYKDLMLQKLVSINGHSIEQITKKLMALSPKENPVSTETELERLLLSIDALEFYKITKPREEIVITTNKGKHIISDLNGEVTQAKPLAWKRKEYENNKSYKGNPTYRYRIEGNTLLFQYNACNNKGYTDKQLKEFQNDLLEDAKTVKNIVVDLRLNDGGTTDLMWDLFEKLPEDKKMFVAMSSSTFSAAMHHLIYMYRAYGADLIGESAGQKPNRFGDREIIKLPESELEVHCSFQYFELLPKQDVDILEAEIPIPVTIDHYATNTDPLNAWIKENLQD